MKGIFKALKNEVVNEIGKQVNKRNDPYAGHGGQGYPPYGGPGAAGPSQSKFDMSAIQGILGMLGGGGHKAMGGGSSTRDGKGMDYLSKVLNAIQRKTGGVLPGQGQGQGNNFLSGILHVAEIIGHGVGDDSPRNQKNTDGTAIDNFLRTVISGRKIHGGHADTYKPFGTPMFPTSSPYGGVSSPSAVQDFHQIRQSCLYQGALFEDPEFPAIESSAFFSSRGRRNFTWLRPHEIHPNPNFFVEGASRFDVVQGELGDCWLLAAVANLTLNPHLFHQVVPTDNSFERGQYAGIFHFRFWQYGRWVDVVVDDRLPTSGGKLLFMHSETRNEFWSALLEKAYAKLHGSYEALKGGTACEAQEDFTGGVTEIFDIKSTETNLFKMLLQGFERGSLIACSIEPDPYVLEAETSSGLVRGHAYSITSVKFVDISTPRTQGKIPLLRIRNPWGRKEWKGAWSDSSPEWNYIDNRTKHQLGLTFDADGEFWMSFQDFCTHFDQVEICSLSPDSPHDGNVRTWDMNVFEGAWIFGQSAGGCRNFLDTFPMNPQYLLDLPFPDEQDPEGKCSVIIALMQKNRRAMRNAGGVETLTIGFAVYKLPSSQNLPLTKEFFKFNSSTARSPTFINLREVCSRFKLRPGRYAIIPSTYDAGEEGEFLIRVFTERGGKMSAFNGYSETAPSGNVNSYSSQGPMPTYPAPHYPPSAPPSVPHPQAPPSGASAPPYPTAPSAYPPTVPYPSQSQGLPYPTSSSLPYPLPPPQPSQTSLPYPAYPTQSTPYFYPPNPYQ